VKTGAVRHVPAHGQALGPGRVGRVRLLREPLAVLLGLRLYLVCTPSGMPIQWALANPKLGEREVLEACDVAAEH
jgi:hypothetical protein